MKYYAPKGLYDITPEEVDLWQLVEEKVREEMDRYRYREIRTPLMEKTEVFARGVGEETEVVSKQMYTFEDKGGRSITLRPEGTASVVRAYLEHKMYGREELSKLYYLGPMFRYETPQKGRSRQFHQYGAEAIGSSDPALDAELIELSISILEALKVEEVGVKLNSIGCSEDREEYVDQLRSFLEPKRAKLCSDCQKRLEANPLRILDCKEESCSRLIAEAPRITDYLCSECEEHFEGVRNYLDRVDLDYELNPRLVRGLDYYARTVFEVFSADLGAQDALLGGGRYDGLIELLGGDPIPAAGFAAGIERLILLLQERDGLSTDGKLDLYLATLDQETKEKGFELLRRLRKSGINAELDYLDKSLQGQLGYADRFGADYTAILGPRELKEGKITIRDMESGEQQLLELGDLEGSLAEILEKDGQ